MHVEIGTKAAQFSEKEYMNEIFVTVRCLQLLQRYIFSLASLRKFRIFSP